MNFIKMFFSDKTKFIYRLIITASMTLMVFIFFFLKCSRNRESDFLLADKFFANWKKEGLSSDINLINLEKLMESHDELKVRYGGDIGNKLLSSIDFEKAIPYIEHVLDRTDRKYYFDYSTASIKIAKGEHSEALTDSIELKRILLDDKNNVDENCKFSTLFAFNCVRIAFLYQMVEDYLNEIKMWEEIEGYIGDNKTNFKEKKFFEGGFDKVIGHFTSKDITLLDYINNRKKEISKFCTS